MVSGLTCQLSPGQLREQLLNLLKLLERSGVEEVILPGGAERLVADLGRLAAAEARVGAPESPAKPVGTSTAKTGAGSRSQGAEPHEGGRLASLCREVEICRSCELHRGRTNPVFGEGDTSAKLMFVGEGPGADEDAQGRPFVGRAGMLLTRIIEAMGLKRGQVYIGNIVKCRPPGNRVPEPDEIASCLPYLEKQIETIRPEIICTLGNVATQTITGERRPISEMRGKTYAYRTSKVVPTYHPAACLRNPDCKKLVWEDIKIVMKHLNLPIRGVTSNGAGKNRN